MELAISSTKFKLLSVDDDAGFSQNVVSALADEFEVSLASDASEALATLKRDAFDCVLLDMNLPEIDGLRLLKMLRGLFPAMPVIMLTGNKTPDKIVRAIKEGASDYVIKEPKDLELELKFKITKAVEQQGLISRTNQLEKKVTAESHRYEIRGSGRILSHFQHCTRSARFGRRFRAQKCSCR
jgi:PleD family two-component response regulator